MVLQCGWNQGYTGCSKNIFFLLNFYSFAFPSRPALGAFVVRKAKGSWLYTCNVVDNNLENHSQAWKGEDILITKILVIFFKTPNIIERAIKRMSSFYPQAIFSWKSFGKKMIAVWAEYPFYDPVSVLAFRKISCICLLMSSCWVIYIGEINYCCRTTLPFTDQFD